jgi:hypothetical protein
MFRASFGDDTASSKKFEASVIRLNPSPQVMHEVTVYQCTATEEIFLGSSVDGS